MSCQFIWNYDDYKFNNRFSKENTLSRLVAPVYLSGIENNTLEELRGQLIIDVSITLTGEFEEFQNNYNIIINSGNNTIGSLYVTNLIRQEKTGIIKSQLKNKFGTVSCKGIFSKFNNGTAIVEYNNDTGRRCLTLYEKN